MRAEGRAIGPRVLNAVISVVRRLFRNTQACAQPALLPALRTLSLHTAPAMALRRSFCSMSSVLNGLQRLALLEAPCAAQQLGTASTLSSLRCLAPAVSQTARSSPAAAAGGCRQYAAAAAPTPAAAAAAEAPAAAEDESLEQIRSRIFGTHIGE